MVVHPSALAGVHVLMQVKPGSGRSPVPGKGRSGSSPVPGKGAGGTSGSATDRQDQSDTSVIDTSASLTRAAVLPSRGGSPRQVQVCTPPSSSWIEFRTVGSSAVRPRPDRDDGAEPRSGLGTGGSLAPVLRTPVRSGVGALAVVGCGALAGLAL